MELKNKVAVVTGVSRGIGKACVDALLSQGVKVAGWGLRKPEFTHPDFYFIQCNVKTPSAVESACLETLQRFSTINILINNAGLGYFGKIEEMSLEHWHEMFSLNVHGVFYCLKNVIPIMRKQKSGHIINISSIAGNTPVVEGSGYSATKAAVKAITHSIYREVRNDNIKVTALYPGSTNTDFFHNFPNSMRAEDMIDTKDIADIIIHLLKTPDDFLPLDLEVRTMKAK